MDRRDVLRSCWERRGRARWLPQVERPWLLPGWAEGQARYPTAWVEAAAQKEEVQQPSAPERPGSIGYLQGKPRSPSGCAAASSTSP